MGLDKSRVISNALWYSAASLFSTGVRFLTIPILVRILSPEDFGNVAVSMALLLFMTTVFGTGGFMDTLVYFNKKKPKLFVSLFWFALILGLGLGSLTYLLTNYFVEWVNTPNALPYVQVLCGLFPILLINGVCHAQLTADQRFSYIAKVNSAAATISTSLAVFLAFNGFGAWSLIIQHIVSAMIILACFIKPLKSQIRFYFDGKQLLSVMPYFYRSSLYNTIIWLGAQAPIVASAKLFNASASGIYSMTQRVSMLPKEVLGQGFLMSFFSSIASKESSTADRQASVFWAVKINTLVLGSIYTFAAINAQELVYIILGDKFEAHWPLFATLCIGMAFVSTTGGFVGYLKGTGQVNLMTGFSLLRTGLVCSLMYGLYLNTPQLSSIADAVALTNILITLCYFTAMFIILGFDLRDFSRQVMPIMLAVFITAISTYLVKSLLVETFRINLFASLMLTSVIYPALLLITCSLFSFPDTKLIYQKLQARFSR